MKTNAKQAAPGTTVGKGAVRSTMDTPFGGKGGKRKVKRSSPRRTRSR